MNRRTLWLTIVLYVSFAGASHAQQIEAVHLINADSTNRAEAALDTLFEDDAMKGARVTLYQYSFGDMNSSHIIVADFDDYDDYMKSNEKRLGSHGWARYRLMAQDNEYLGSNLMAVVDDHGAARHTAGYLAAFAIRTPDPATYRQAITDLNEAAGNPGVLRLVAARTGNREATHFVLIGGEDFRAVNEYLDELFASEAFAEFSATVADIREVVSVTMYRRVATWGD